ncbi:MAG: hypothetical protein M1825_002086 [Sarcosagium campestre]|nr:MAG: hypothetical protein M1825_002086 [Sarcosagium campestre]
MLLRKSILLVALSPLCLADILFTRPQAGASLSARSPITLEWRDSGEAPSLSDLKYYTLAICAGTEEDPTILATLKNDAKFDSKSNSLSITIDPSFGASTHDNAYFFRMTTKSSTSRNTVHTSPTFSLTDMTGTFPARLVSQLSKRQVAAPGVAAPAVPPAAGAAAPAAGAAGDFNMAFSLQDGPTRFAPMQKQPGKSITATNTEPQYPVSKTVIATTFLAIPEAKTTITQSATDKVSSRENDAEAAAQPTDDMAKFLARWKD